MAPAGRPSAPRRSSVVARLGRPGRAVDDLAAAVQARRRHACCGRHRQGRVVLLLRALARRAGPARDEVVIRAKLLHGTAAVIVPPAASGRRDVAPETLDFLRGRVDAAILSSLAIAHNLFGLPRTCRRWPRGARAHARSQRRARRVRRRVVVAPAHVGRGSLYSSTRARTSGDRGRPRRRQRRADGRGTARGGAAPRGAGGKAVAGSAEAAAYASAEAWCTHPQRVRSCSRRNALHAEIHSRAQRVLARWGDDAAAARRAQRGALSGAAGLDDGIRDVANVTSSVRSRAAGGLSPLCVPVADAAERRRAHRSPPRPGIGAPARIRLHRRHQSGRDQAALSRDVPGGPRRGPPHRHAPTRTLVTPRD